MTLTPALPSVSARRALGRAQREQTPRLSLATLADRPAGYDCVSRLEWQSESRVAALLPIRYQRMLASPLAFYRGSALLMAEDLARGPSTSLEVQICGDAHLSNFGVFSSPERKLVFDVNDFDETDQGPFEWDVKRLVASLVVASQHLGHDQRQQETVARECAKEYRLSMQRFASESRLDVWYATLDVNTVMNSLQGFFADHAMQKVDNVIRGAHGHDASKAYGRMVTYTDDGPRITPQPPLVTPLSELVDGSLNVRDVLDRVLSAYSATLSSDRRALLAQFTPVDAAHMVVGVGSVGTRCYAMLLVGRDQDDPFFLQFKEAQASVVSLSRATLSATAPGERIVNGQKLMQATPDAFLGWHSMRVDRTDRSFYVRQLYDAKALVTIEHLDEPLLVAYGRVCAWALARAHARSGRAAEIDGYLGKNDQFETSLATFALAYRDRNLADFQALQRAAQEGRVSVAS